MKTDRAIGAALILATALTWALYALDVETPVRAALAVAYLLVAPGLAVMSLLDLAQRWAVAVLAVAVSLGLVTVAATALLLVNLWTPGRALAIVGCMTLLAAGARIAISSGAQVPVTAALPEMERRKDGS
jgi:hypothetical protein